MAGIVTIDGAEINLLHPTDTQWRRIQDLYETPCKGAIRCIKHNSPMFLQKRSGHLWAIHYAGYTSGDDSCNHKVGGPPGPAHRNMVQHVGDTARAAGYQVDEEFVTPSRKTRLDLRIQAPVTFGAEIQDSQIKDPDVKSRTTKSYRDGVPPAWFSPRRTTWDIAAPTIRSVNVDWTEGIPKRVLAHNIRQIIAEPCRPDGRLPYCPDKGRGRFCHNNRHPWYEMVEAPPTWAGAISGIGNGEFSFHTTWNGYGLIVPTDDLDLYRNLTGQDGLFQPGGRHITSPPTGDRVECVSNRLIEMSNWQYGDQCALWCGRELWAPPSIARGICEPCWLSIDRGRKPIQLTLNIAREVRMNG